MSKSLFRPEVFEARRTRLHGSVHLSDALVTWRSVSALTLAVIGSAACAAFIPFARTEELPGVVVATIDPVKVVLPRAGIVSLLYTSEGVSVAQHQVLAKIATDLTDSSGRRVGAVETEAIRQQLAINQHQLATERLRSSANADKALGEIRSGVQRLAGLKARIGVQQQILSSTKSLFDQLGGVIKSGFVSRMDFERRRQTYLEQLAQLQSLQQDYRDAALSLDNAHAAQVADKLDASDRVAALEMRGREFQKALANAKLASDYLVTAPLGGTVNGLQIFAGKAVRPDMIGMTIVPQTSELSVNLFASSRAIGNLVLGQSVRLTYDAFPFDKFGSYPGRIVGISRAVQLPSEIDSPLALHEATYRVRVQLIRNWVETGEVRRALRPGMTLRGRVTLDRRPLFSRLIRTFANFDSNR